MYIIDTHIYISIYTYICIYIYLLVCIYMYIHIHINNFFNLLLGVVNRGKGRSRLKKKPQEFIELPAWYKGSRYGLATPRYIRLTL